MLKEPSHSFEQPQRMFWLRNKKINFCNLIKGLFIGVIDIDVRNTNMVDVLKF